MKKKLLLIVLMGICLLGITGCGGNSNKEMESINITDDNLKLTTTFEYGKDAGFKFEKNVTGGRFAEIEFSNEKYNLYFNMYYTQSSSDLYKSLRTNRAGDKYYKELKYGDYEGYTYGNDNDRLYAVLVLKTDDKTKENIELFVSIDKIKYSGDEEVAIVFKSDAIQDFFSSIKITED